MKREINIPTEWSDVRYKDYYRFVKSIEGNEEDNKLVMDMALQYLCGLNVEDYYSLDQETFSLITEDMATLLNKQDKQPLVTSFNSGITQYKINPNIEQMSYGEYLDLTVYSKELWKNIPIVCSILYRPVDKQLGSSYTIKPYAGTNDATVNMFRELLTMDIVFGVVAFFLTLQKDLLQVSLTSSLNLMEKEMTIQQRETLEKNGVDIKLLSRYLEGISSNLIK